VARWRSRAYFLGGLWDVVLEELLRPAEVEVAGGFPFGGRSATTIFQSLSSFDHFPIASTLFIAIPPETLKAGKGKRHASGASGPLWA
jgi:hypothetical protein